MKDKEMIIEEMANVSTEQEQRERAKKGREKDELIQALLHYATAEASGGIKSLIDCEGCAFYLYEMLGYRKLPEDSILLSKEELEKIVDQTKETEKNYYKKVVIPQASKETAEKIAREVLELFPKDKQFTTISRATIYELVLKNGVEIKE